MAGHAKKFRIVVAFDIDNTHIEEAYASLCEYLGHPPDNIEWTPTTEWRNLQNDSLIPKERRADIMYKYWCRPENEEKSLK